LLGRAVLLSSPRRHHVLRTFSIGRSRRGTPLGTGLPAGTYLQRRLSWPALVEWRLHISSRTIAWRSTAARPSRRAHCCHAAIRRQGGGGPSTGRGIRHSLDDGRPGPIRKARLKTLGAVGRCRVGRDLSDLPAIRALVWAACDRGWTRVAGATALCLAGCF